MEHSGRKRIPSILGLFFALTAFHSHAHASCESVLKELSHRKIGIEEISHSNVYLAINYTERGGFTLDAAQELGLYFLAGLHQRSSIYLTDIAEEFVHSFVSLSGYTRYTPRGKAQAAQLHGKNALLSEPSHSINALSEDLASLGVPLTEWQISYLTGIALNARNYGDYEKLDHFDLSPRSNFLDIGYLRNLYNVTYMLKSGVYRSGSIDAGGVVPLFGPPVHFSNRADLTEALKEGVAQWLP